jgi:hypothetical protein
MSGSYIDVSPWAFKARPGFLAMPSGSCPNWAVLHRARAAPGRAARLYIYTHRLFVLRLRFIYGLVIIWLNPFFISVSKVEEK